MSNVFPRIGSGKRARQKSEREKTSHVCSSRLYRDYLFTFIVQSCALILKNVASRKPQNERTCRQEDKFQGIAFILYLVLQDFTMWFLQILQSLRAYCTNKATAIRCFFYTNIKLLKKLIAPYREKILEFLSHKLFFNVFITHQWFCWRARDKEQASR